MSGRCVPCDQATDLAAAEYALERALRYVQLARAKKGDQTINLRRALVSAKHAVLMLEE